MSKIIDRWWEVEPDRYEARERISRYVVSAAIAISSLLVLSREALPAEPLAQHWWLYRLTLILSAFAALTSFLVVLFSYRERFYWSHFERNAEDWSRASRIRRLYTAIGRARRPLEFGLYWSGLVLAPVAFSLALLTAGSLVVVCLWQPAPAPGP